MRIKIIAIIVVLLVIQSNSYSLEVFLSEKFRSLDDWEELKLPKIKRHSKYSIMKYKNKHMLKIEAANSASALVYKKEFNVYKYPVVTWRWKISNIYKNGDAKKKSGDDYPLRIYIMFKYDPTKAGLLQKARYNTARLIYGKYPPHSVVSYIWANREHAEYVLTNKYADNVKMILIEKGVKNLGKWQSKRVNILNDYLKAFGEKPPAIASIAIMGDADNTGEKSTAYLDNITIRKK